MGVGVGVVEDAGVTITSRARPLPMAAPGSATQLHCVAGVEVSMAQTILLETWRQRLFDGAISPTSFCGRLCVMVVMTRVRLCATEIIGLLVLSPHNSNTWPPVIGGIVVLPL